MPASPGSDPTRNSPLNPRLLVAVVLLPVATALAAVWFFLARDRLAELQGEADRTRARAEISRSRDAALRAMDRLEALAFIDLYRGRTSDAYRLALGDFETSFGAFRNTLVRSRDDLAVEAGMIQQLERETERYRRDHPRIERPSQVPEASWRFLETVGWPTISPPSGKWNAYARALDQLAVLVAYPYDHVDTTVAQLFTEEEIQAQSSTARAWIRTVRSSNALENEAAGPGSLDDAGVLRLVRESLDLENLGRLSPDLAADLEDLATDSDGMELIRATTPFMLGRVSELEEPPESLFIAMDRLADRFAVTITRTRSLLDGLIAEDLREARRQRNWAAAAFGAPLLLALGLIFSVERRRRRIQTALLEAAEHDPLTGLPNRFALQRRTPELLGSDPDRDLFVSFAIIDLDHFKPINDAFGHQVGDQVLVEFARRLRAVLREGELVFRLGGDEFVILVVQDSDDDTRTHDLAGEIDRALEEPVATPEHRIGLTASYGSTCKRLPTEISELLVEADLALHEVKENQKGGHLAYRHTERGPLVRNLQAVLDREEVEFVFQPQLHLPSGEVIGVEGLCRWPSGSSLSFSPPDIVDSVEWLGATQQFLRNLIVRFEEAADILGDSFHGRFWLNVWPLQLVTRDQESALEAVFTESRLAEERLGIEITENRVIPDLPRAVGTLESLRAAGVQVALDDFGVYNASLERLTSLPLDVVKLDQRLIRGISHSREQQLFVGSLRSICASRGIATLAEGVEQIEDLETLARLRVDQAQGFLATPAMPARELKQFLERWDPSPIAAATRRGADAPGSEQWDLG